MFETPILLLIFNRPAHTKMVFDRIREVRPAYLYVVADGPREGNDGDEHNSRMAREIISEGVDWPCQVKTIFRDKNLGCGLSPANGITWFFQQVGEGIILEDDCLPSPSFFNYCEILLNHYRDNDRVMHIGGTNYQNGIYRSKGSYYFSAYTHNWGWATWRNRWAFFNFEMSDYTDEWMPSISKYYGFEKDEALFWQHSFRSMIDEKRNDIWDFRWLHAVWKNKGLSILPNVNLVENIGFGMDATHTHVVPEEEFSNKVFDIDVVVHPPEIFVNRKADRYTYKRFFNPRRTILTRVIGLMKRTFQ